MSLRVKPSKTLSVFEPDNETDNETEKWCVYSMLTTFCLKVTQGKVLHSIDV